jgi:hypothetical protein
VYTEKKLQQGKEFLENLEGVSVPKEQALLHGLLQCETKRNPE